jgi:hypothetical protein
MDDPLKITIIASLKSLVVSILVGLGFIKKNKVSNMEKLDEFKVWQENIEKELHEQTHINEELQNDLEILKEFANISLQAKKCILDYLERDTDEKGIEESKGRIDKFLFDYFS